MYATASQDVDGGLLFVRWCWGMAAVRRLTLTSIVTVRIHSILTVL